MNKENNVLSRRNFLATTGILTAGFMFYPRALFAQTSPVTTIINEAAKSPVTATALRNGITLLEGSGGNVAVFAGSEGMLMVDAGIDVSKKKILAALKKISGKPLKFLINSHWHFDHASGNEWLHHEGAKIIAHANTKKHLSNRIRIEDWNYTFDPVPIKALPTVVFNDKHKIKINGDTVSLDYYGAAHTDSDISIHFENANLLHTADTWWNGHYPFIDYKTGGSIKGMISASTKNIERVNNETIVIPGHGPVGSKANLIEFRDMLVEISQKVESLKKQGKPLNEVIAEKPTKGYDAKWGKFVINGDFFTNLVYRGV